MSLIFPPDYGLVLLTASGTFVLSTVHAIAIGNYFRPKANIRYPRLYATEEEAAANPATFTYNCAQRTHANYLENLFPMTGSMLIAGLQYPRLAAGLGLGWAACRVLYFYNYVQVKHGEVVHGQPPSGKGGLFWLFQFVLYGTAIKASWDIHKLSAWV